MTAPGLVTLQSGDARAAISPLGADWRNWRVDDTELLWTPDPAFWDAVSPVLFPVCGWTRDRQARVGGKTYPLGLHGFARFQMFEIVARGEDFARLVLRDNEATRAQYPFAFELSLEYRIAGPRLSVEARVKNTGGEAMPYAFGLHPGFRWPMAGGEKREYAIRFDRSERPEVPVIAPGGLFSSATWPIGFADPRTMPLSDEIFAREALCFLDVASGGLDLMGPRGRVLRVEWDNSRHVVLWSRPGAPFLCIETLTGHGDPEHFDGELSHKPSMNLLAAGVEARHGVSYIFGAD